MLISVIGLRGFPGVQGGVEMHTEHIYNLLPPDDTARIYRRKPYLNEKSFVGNKTNLKFIDLPSTRIKGIEAVLHTFLSCLHIITHRPDVVHVHNIGPGMFIPLLKLFRLKVVMTYHSPNYEHNKWSRFGKAVLRLSEKLSLGTADKVIFVNKFQMEKYGEKTKRKSVYIPNGVEPANKISSTEFLQKHGIKSGEYILGVGRITPEKGFEYLVEAANQLETVKQVVIAGASDHDSEYLKKLKELDTNNKVIFTGFTSGNDLAELYTHAKTYVMSSVNEGFPLVLLEAMSYGLPIVATDILGTRLVDLPEECYVKVSNSHSLAEGITRINMLYDNAHQPEYNLSAFSWPKVADDTLNIIITAL